MDESAWIYVKKNKEGHILIYFNGSNELDKIFSAYLNTIRVYCTIISKCVQSMKKFVFITKILHIISICAGVKNTVAHRIYQNILN